MKIVFLFTASNTEQTKSFELNAVFFRDYGILLNKLLFMFIFYLTKRNYKTWN